MAQHQPAGSPTWMSYEALAAVMLPAAAVRVVRGAEINWRRRKLTPDVIRVDHKDDIAALVEALRYEEPAGDVALMQWPDLTFGFVTAGQGVLAELLYLQSGWLRHATWPGDRPLSSPQRVEAWLATHGGGSTVQ